MAQAQEAGSRPGLARRAAHGSGHLLLALMVVGPALAPGRLLGHPDADIWNHAWGPWWYWQTLSSGELPWRTELLHAPIGGELFFIDPLLALLGAPLVPLFGAADATDLALLLMLAFASWAVGRFARELGASRSAAWLASTAFVASAWISCESTNGITEAVDIGPVALALALGERACQSRHTTDWLAAGLAAGLTALASPYLALGTAIALFIRGLPHLHRAWPGGLLAVLLGALPLALLGRQLSGLDAIVRRPEGMNDQLALHNAVDPRTFFQPFGFRSVDLSAEAMQHSGYLGLVALGLALVAVLRAPRARPWVLPALACLVASMGPWLYWGGDWVLTGSGSRLGLPWLALQRLAPGLAVTHPLRLSVAALAIVAALAAVGAGRLLGSRALWMLPLLLLDGLGLSGAPWPVPTAPATYPATNQPLIEAPADRTWIVLDLPSEVGSSMRTSRYLYWQTGHGRPIPYGPDARASTSILVSEPPFRALAVLEGGRQSDRQRLGLTNDEQADEQARVKDLAQLGVRWIALHRELDPQVAPAIQARLEAELGPGQAFGQALLWDLGAEASPQQNHVDQLRAGRAAGGVPAGSTH